MKVQWMGQESCGWTKQRDAEKKDMRHLKGGKSNV